MKENPSVPAQTVTKHIQSSKNRIARMAKDAEFFRAGLRELQMATVTLRTTLEDRPDELAKMEGGLMALSYSSGNILAAIDQSIRLELALQAEALRWLHGKTPLIERGRPHLAYQQANGRPGHPERNGSALAPSGKFPEVIKATGHEVPTRQPDPNVAVGFYLGEDGKRVYMNAYDQIVEPPPEHANVAISVDLPAQAATPSLEEFPPRGEDESGPAVDEDQPTADSAQ